MPISTLIKVCPRSTIKSVGFLTLDQFSDIYKNTDVAIRALPPVSCLSDGGRDVKCAVTGLPYKFYTLGFYTAELNNNLSVIWSLWSSSECVEEQDRSP